MLFVRRPGFQARGSRGPVKVTARLGAGVGRQAWRLSGAPVGVPPWLTLPLGVQLGRVGLVLGARPGSQALGLAMPAGAPR